MMEIKVTYFQPGIQLLLKKKPKRRRRRRRRRRRGRRSRRLKAFVRKLVPKSLRF